MSPPRSFQSSPTSVSAGTGSTDRRSDHLSRAKFQELRAGIWSRNELTQRQKERIDEELRLYFGGGIRIEELRNIIQDVVENRNATVKP